MIAAAFRHLARALALLVLLAPPSASQRVQLGAPDASLAEEFSAIRGVRELSDGRVLVSDYLDQRVVLVDLARKSVTARVTRGAGPREARLPTRLIAIHGDSTILVDLGNNRLDVLDGEGRVARTIPAERPGVLGVRGVDASGRLYFAVPAWAEEASMLPNDSVRVVRWNPLTQVMEPVAVIQGDRMRSDIRSPALTPRIPTVGYAAQDAWVVTEEGVMRIVRGGDYRIESRARGGAATSGPSYAFATRAVTAADKREYVRQFNAASPMSGKGEGGGMGFAPQLNEEELAAMTRGTQFAERMPMFSAGDVLAAPGGRLWVGHQPESGKAVVYDVFDSAGRRVSTVELRSGRRVLAVGRRGVYVAAESDDGIQRLERYAVPRP